MSNNTLMGNIDVLKLSNEKSNKITIKCLDQALIILIKKIPFKKITIKKLDKKAGV